MGYDFLKYLPLYKVDEVTHEAYGLVTAEITDKDGEICDYSDTAPLYKNWSDEALKSTTAAGQDLSLGNVRLQHTMEIAGKLTQLDLDSELQQIRIGTSPVDDRIWGMLKGGYLRGFSHGGRYVYRKCETCKSDMTEVSGNRCPKCKKNVIVRYAAKPSEVSYVDNPCLGEAVFSYVKADGSSETRKFQVPEVKPKEVVQVKKESKTKRVAGEDLPASAFAYVGDPEKTETWKLPIKFSSEEKSKRHVRNALSRFSNTDLPADAKARVKAKILAAARRLGIDASEDSDKAAKIQATVTNILTTKSTELGLTKSMFSIASIAEVLVALRGVLFDTQWEAEYEGGSGDERDAVIAVELKAAIEHLVEILKEVVEEETAELVEGKALKGVSDMTELEKKASLKAHFEKAAAHHEHMAELHKSKMEEHEAHMETHKAMMEHCAKCMGKAVDDADLMKEADGEDGKDGMDMGATHKAMFKFHKASHGHHKAHASLHEKLHKAHAAHAEHMKKAAGAWGMEEVPGKTVTSEVTKAAGLTQEDLQKELEASRAATKAEVGNIIKTFKADLDAMLDKKLEPLPKGFTLVPRGPAKAAAALGPDDTGLPKR